MPVKKTKPKKPAAPKKKKDVDFSAIPAELITQHHREVCLACVLDVMTRHLGLSAARAQMQIKRYTPSLAELRDENLSRPFFLRKRDAAPCPYCAAAVKWHARIELICIENAKSIETQRRALLKSLPEASFAILEEKATQQDAFFQWVERIGATLDLDDPRWLKDVSLHYLARKDPKSDWDGMAPGIRSIRRSRRLETGWEMDQGRLFLAPFLFDELLLVQYVMSRAHRAGGLTLEGRYTLHELFSRLRNSGYLRSLGVLTASPSDAFEEALRHLGGGDVSQRFYYVVDRRDLLDRIKALKDLRVPKSKPVRA